MPENGGFDTIEHGNEMPDDLVEHVAKSNVIWVPTLSVNYVTDAAKFVSVLMLSLRAMLHLELPHVNVLSKIDLISQYGELGTQTHPLPYLTA